LPFIEIAYGFEVWAGLQAYSGLPYSTVLHCTLPYSTVFIQAH
jgi:hypothetical protein